MNRASSFLTRSQGFALADAIRDKQLESKNAKIHYLSIQT